MPSAALVTAAASLGCAPLATEAENGARDTFSMHYAPHFGMFKNSAGGDLVDQLNFAADQGFTAWEDNGMKGRSTDTQERIAEDDV